MAGGDTSGLPLKISTPAKLLMRAVAFIGLQWRVFRLRANAILLLIARYRRQYINPLWSFTSLQIQ
jgi:hypothetical protein